MLKAGLDSLVNMDWSTALIKHGLDCIRKTWTDCISKTWTDCISKLTALVKHGLIVLTDCISKTWTHFLY